MSPLASDAVTPALPILPALAATLAAVLAGVAVGVATSPLWMAVLALPLLVAVVLRPVVGVVTLLLVGPLIVGIGRGSFLPLLRPSEGLLLIVLLGLVLHRIGVWWRGGRWWPMLDEVDVALLLLALSGSVIPLLVRFGRGLPISMDDLLYALVLWKCWLAFRVARDGVHDERERAACLLAALVAAAIVALVGLAQVLHVPGVAEFLWRHYDQPFTGYEAVIVERGTSTVASSLGVANIMAMCLAVVVAALPRVATEPRVVLVAAAALYGAGGLAAGQFSGVVALLVAVAVAAFLTGQLGRIALAVGPFALLAAIPLWPVIERRLAGFDEATGLPPSWLGRLDNLQRFVMPELATFANWLTGVRPAARIPAPEPWRDYVYIESGYVWLLWSGGIVMLAAFAGFVVLAGRALWQRAHARGPATRVAAVAALAALVQMVVLMLLDPHLTMRGGADLFFPLLGLALGTATVGARVTAARPHRGAFDASAAA